MSLAERGRKMSLLQSRIRSLREALGVIENARSSGIVLSTIGALAMRLQEPSLVLCFDLLPGESEAKRDLPVEEASRLWVGELRRAEQEEGQVRRIGRTEPHHGEVEASSA